MSFLEDVKKIIEDEFATALPIAVDMAIMPASPPAVEDIIIVSESQGLAPSNLGSSRMPNLQVRVRASEDNGYVAARANIDSVYELLTNIGNEFRSEFPEGYDVNGNHYSKFDAVQEPFPLKTDEKGRHELAVNFIVTYYRS